MSDDKPYTDPAKSKRMWLALSAVLVGLLQSKGVDVGWITPEMQQHIAEFGFQLFGIAAFYVGIATNRPLGFFKS